MSLLPTPSRLKPTGNMQRLELKWQTIRGLVPQAEVAQGQRVGVLFYGTTAAHA